MGAPQAAGQGRLRGSRPGALFRCPVTPEEYDCERVDIDGDGEWTPTDFGNCTAKRASRLMLTCAFVCNLEAMTFLLPSV